MIRTIYLTPLAFVVIALAYAMPAFALDDANASGYKACIQQALSVSPVNESALAACRNQYYPSGTGSTNTSSQDLTGAAACVRQAMTLTAPAAREAAVAACARQYYPQMGSTTPSAPPSSVSQNTLSDLQAQLAAVERQLAQLLQQLGAGGCPNIFMNLARGMNDAQTGGGVSALQRYLRSTGDFTHPEITGFFGWVTGDALAKFQKRNGIATTTSQGLGRAGPLTRNVIAAICSNIPNPVPVVQAPPASPTPTNPVSTNALTSTSTAIQAARLEGPFAACKTTLDQVQQCAVANPTNPSQCSAKALEFARCAKGIAAQSSRQPSRPDLGSIAVPLGGKCPTQFEQFRQCIIPTNSSGDRTAAANSSTACQSQRQTYLDCIKSSFLNQRIGTSTPNIPPGYVGLTLQEALARAGPRGSHLGMAARTWGQMTAEERRANTDKYVQCVNQAGDQYNAELRASLGPAHMATSQAEWDAAGVVARQKNREAGARVQECRRQYQPWWEESGVLDALKDTWQF